MSYMTLSSQQKALFQQKNSLTTPIFLLSSSFRAHPTTLLLKILGGQMHGPSPPQILGDRPQSSLGLRPCKKDIFAPSHVPFRPLNQPLLEKVGIHPVILRNKFI